MVELVRTECFISFNGERATIDVPVNGIGVIIEGSDRDENPLSVIYCTKSGNNEFVNKIAATVGIKNLLPDKKRPDYHKIVGPKEAVLSEKLNMSVFAVSQNPSSVEKKLRRARLGESES
jgi:hypothetical protein